MSSKTWKAVVNITKKGYEYCPWTIEAETAIKAGKLFEKGGVNWIKIMQA